MRLDDELSSLFDSDGWDLTTVERAFIQDRDLTVEYDVGELAVLLAQCVEVDT